MKESPSFTVHNRVRSFLEGHSAFICLLGLAKWDLLGLGAESWFVLASYPFAKMIPQFGKRKGCYSKTITLLQGPKDPFLPTLMFMPLLFHDIFMHCPSNILLIDRENAITE